MRYPVHNGRYPKMDKTFSVDVSHVVVRQYHHLGEDIGFDE